MPTGQSSQGNNVMSNTILFAALGLLAGTTAFADAPARHEPAAAFPKESSPDVLTAKHVGGFCLWDSKCTNYDVMHPECPYKRDLVAQFINSFKNRGLQVGPWIGPRRNCCSEALRRRSDEPWQAQGCVFSQP